MGIVTESLLQLASFYKGSYNAAITFKKSPDSNNQSSQQPVLSLMFLDKTSENL